VAVLVSDSFNRADSTTTLGVADTGQAWVVDAGVWGISTNKAYSSTTGAVSTAHIETGVSNSTVAANITWVSQNQGLILRLTDVNNYIGCRLGSSNLLLFKLVAGVATTLGIYNVMPVSGTTYALQIAADGTNISVALDGVDVITGVTDAFNQTATKVALRATMSVVSPPTFDNFTVNSVPTGGTVYIATRQSIYQPSSVDVATKQIINLTSLMSVATTQVITDSLVSSTALATRQSIYQTSSTNIATKQVIYQVNLAVYATQQSIYGPVLSYMTERGRWSSSTLDERGRTVFGNLSDKGQAVFEASSSGSSVGSVSYTTKQTINQTSLTSFATKQSIGQISSVAYVTQQIITSGTSASSYITELGRWSSSVLDESGRAVFGSLTEQGHTVFIVKASAIGTLGSFSYATKQIVNQTSLISFATKQILNKIGSITIATQQIISQASPISETYMTRQIIYRIGSVSYATQQRTKIVGSASFTTRQVISRQSISESENNVKKRWMFGGYELKINPKTFNPSYSQTSSGEVTANGIISTNNDFYDKQLDFSFDIYGAPTNFSTDAMVSFSNGLYVSITDNILNDEIFCLKSNNVVDVISTLSGSISRSISLAFSGTPQAIARLDQGMAILYSNGNLYITDENGAQISKYIYSDIDIINCLSITWDSNNYLYLMNKYGKIFRADISSGATSLVYISDDFDNNMTINSSVYSCIHYFDGFMGLIKNNMLVYLDENFYIIYGTEAILGNNKLIGISFNRYSREFYVLSLTQIRQFYPNTCGIDVVRVKNQLHNGIIQISDEKGLTRYLSVKGMKFQRKRNKQDSRYEVSINGKIL
jgi:hypothetical protein